MNISINWGTRVIFVPKSELEEVDSTTYKLDINKFRLALKDKEDDALGIVNPDTHIHYPPIQVGGITLARVVQIINGYTVEFENGNYIVDLYGANSNISEVTRLNCVSVRSHNSAGLIDASFATPDDIARAVWQYASRTLTSFGDLESKIDILLDVEQGDWEIRDNQMIFYKRNGDELMRFDLYDKAGLPSEINVFRRVRQ